MQATVQRTAREKVERGDLQRHSSKRCPVRVLKREERWSGELERAGRELDGCRAKEEGESPQEVGPLEPSELDWFQCKVGRCRCKVEGARRNQEGASSLLDG